MTGTHSLASSLTHLNLSGCYSLTDQGLTSLLVSPLPSLTSVNLSLCKEVSDRSLGRLGSVCPALRSLDLGGCTGVTNSGLLLLARTPARAKQLMQLGKHELVELLMGRGMEKCEDVEKAISALETRNHMKASLELVEALVSNMDDLEFMFWYGVSLYASLSDNDSSQITQNMGELEIDFLRSVY